MMFGVTEVYFILMMVVEVCIYVSIGGGRGLLAVAVLTPVLYAFGYLMCLRDPRIFEIWLIRLRFFSRARRCARFWHGSSFDPS